MILRKEHLYPLPIILVLLTQELFYPFQFNDNLENIVGMKEVYVDLAVWIAKLITFISFVYALFGVFKLKSVHRIILSILIIQFIYLIFESLYFYGTFIHYPLIFYKISSIILAFSVVIFYKDKEGFTIHPIMIFIIIGLAMKITVVPSLLSFSSFLSHHRGVESTSAYLLLLPCLFFFNTYVEKKTLSSLALFVGLLFIIIILQHRTVWVCTFFSFAIATFILVKQGKLNLKTILQGVIPQLAVFAIGITFVIFYDPNIQTKIEDNVFQILNPNAEKTTSSWRIQQFESYSSFVLEKPVFGWRLKGLELPLQFYNEANEMIWDEEQVGHHFHSFYLDKAFYFGFALLLFLIVLLIRPLYLAIKNNLKLGIQQRTLIAYVSSSIIYSMTYDLPLNFWMFFGLAIIFAEYRSEK